MPGSVRMAASAAFCHSMLVSSVRALDSLANSSCDSLDRTCFTSGLTLTLSRPLAAARCELALGPLGNRSAVLVVGFCGIDGWTPSTASQCAGIC
jgi:hypothetical protein